MRFLTLLTKNKTMTKQRYVPADYKEFAPEIGDYPKDLFAVYVKTIVGSTTTNYNAMFFTGKQSRPTWHYRFQTIEELKKKVNESITNLIAHEDRKAERKAKRKEAIKNLDSSLVKIGDIYHWSGGYNCTKNAYVKVVGFVGKNKVSVIELPKTQVSGDWMNGEVAPVVDYTNATDSKTLVIRPGYSGGIILRDTRNCYRDDYHKWSGKPNWENCD